MSALVETLGLAVARRPRRVVRRPDLAAAAVLVAVEEREPPTLILTRRTMTVATHKGQISFPGGVAEPADESLEATARREAAEEIGLDPGLPRVLGCLDDLATTTGFVITPVLAIVPPDLALAAAAGEVEEILRVPLDRLAAPGAHDFVTERLADVTHRYHRYVVDGVTIWGATAGIIHDLLERLP